MVSKITSFPVLQSTIQNLSSSKFLQSRVTQVALGALGLFVIFCLSALALGRNKQVSKTETKPSDADLLFDLNLLSCNVSHVIQDLLGGQAHFRERLPLVFYPKDRIKEGRCEFLPAGVDPKEQYQWIEDQTNGIASPFIYRGVDQWGAPFIRINLIQKDNRAFVPQILLQNGKTQGWYLNERKMLSFGEEDIKLEQDNITLLTTLATGGVDSEYELGYTKPL